MDGSIDRLNAALRGRYTVDREIGKGGMAIVYRARDIRHDRWVALKVLRPELSATLAGERFLREIRLAAGLQHPHIVPLHESGEADALLFYVMPYVEGVSLRGRLDREGQLPLDDALRIAREAAEAIHYAHERDVVHRDIKPENILLSGGHALVADFGIARAISAAGGMTLTETGMAVGTPAYMSPEQNVGSRVDGRADVYALGCVLYEMLVGEPPYRGPTAQTIMSQHALAPIPLARAARPSVPDVVEAAIVRAMAKAPADRFATAEAFGAALPLTTSTMLATAARPRATSRKAMLIAATITAIVAASWGARTIVAPSSDPVTVAVAPIRVSDTSDAPFADGLTQVITSALTRVPQLAPRPYASVAAMAQNRNPLELGRELDVEYVLSAHLRRSGDQVRMNTELIRVSDGTLRSPHTFMGADAELFQMQDSIAAQLVRQLVGSFADNATSTRRQPNPEAYKLYLQAVAVPLVDMRGSQTRVRLLSSAVELDPQFADAWAELASAYQNWSQYSPDPPSQLQRSMANAAATALRIDSTNGDAWMNQAYLSWWEWDFEKAIQEFARSVKLRPASGWARIEYAKLLHQLMREDEALKEIEAAIRLDPSNSHFVVIKAYQLQTRGRLHEADSLAMHALALNRDDVVAHIMRAKIAMKERRLEDALAACRIIQNAEGNDNPFALGFISYCYAVAGDTTGARRIQRRLENMSRERFVERAMLVWPYLGLGDSSGALEHLELSAGAREVDFTLLMRESAYLLWREPRYQALLRRSGLDRYWKRPPTP